MNDTTPTDQLPSAKVSTAADGRFALLLGILTAMLTLVPYAFPLLTRPGATGLLYDSAQDACVYLSWMRQAAEGSFLFANRFTTDAQAPAFTHLLFWAMGRLAALFGGSAAALIIIYHGTRVLLTVLLFLVLSRLLAHILPQQRERRIALVFIAFAGGLGWLTACLGVPPAWRGLDFGGWVQTPGGWARAPVMPEAITFLSLLHYPHFAAALLLIAFCLERALRGGTAAFLALAVASLLLAHVHAYDLPALAGALLLFPLLRCLHRHRAPAARDLAPAALVLLGAAPALAHHLHVVATDPLWHAKANVPVPMPPPIQWLPTFGLLLPAAAVGLVVAWRRGGTALLLPAWLAAYLLAACLPVAFPRKMLEGIHLPLAVLAALGICHLAARPRRAWLLPAFTLLACLSTAATLTDARHLRDGGDPWSMYPPLALPAEVRQTYAFLADRARPGDGVLSWRGFALTLPAYTPCAAYAGHWGETPHIADRLQQVAAFYHPNTPPSERERLLAQMRVRFVYVGQSERRLGAGHWDIGAWPRLRLVHAAGDSTLYEVAPSRP